MGEENTVFFIINIVVSIIIAVVLSVSLTTLAFATTDIKLYVNGKLPTADLHIINGSSYVPLKAVSEMLGASVKWDGTTRTITITGKDYNPNSSASVTAQTKSYNVNVKIASGPMQMTISKVTLDPAYQKDQYTDKINAIVMECIDRKHF